MSLRKILITPYFGKFPEWMDKFQVPEGYDWILDTNLEKFKRRVQNKLDIKYPGGWGDSKLGDYRSLLGYLYEDEIKGYDYWGHCDFDMVFGDVDRFFPDEEIEKLDVWSNHDTYICGCWTLYRNCDEVNKLFFKYPYWEKYLMQSEVNGWIENEYSRFLEASGLRYKYSFMQGYPFTTTPNLRKIVGRLYQLHGTETDGSYTEEIPMFHFRRSKKWPL